MIYLNDTKRRYLAHKAEIDRRISSVLSRGVWLMGDSGKEFAENFSRFIGVGHSLPVANGTDALELALKGAGVVPGDEVITVPNASVYSSIAIRACGAMPVYTAVDPETHLADLVAVEKALSEKTKAIIITHLYGNVVDFSQLRERRPRIKFIEDCAEAHGAEINGQKVGSLGDAGVFSFYPTKNLGALGDAGAVVTDNPEIADRINKLRQYGWESKYKTVLSGGRNSRMDEIQAVVLDYFLNLLPGWNCRRKEILARYGKSSSAAIEWVTRNGEGDVAHLAVIKVKDRRFFRKVMEENGVATDVHFPILDFKQPGWEEGSFINYCPPEQQSLPDSLVTIPLFPEMTEEEVETVCALLNSYRSGE